MLEIFARSMRGRAALALAAISVADPSNRQRLLAVAKDQAQILRRSKARYALGLACLLEAGVATVRGDRQGACDFLRHAAVELEKNELIAWLAVARLGLARLVEGEAADQSFRAGMAWMQEQQIRRPECLARMLFPSI